MRFNSTIGTLRALLLAAIVLHPLLIHAASDYNSNYKLAMEAYRAEQWERAGRLAAHTLKQIESSEWKDWVYNGERKPFMTYFTGDYAYVATSDDDQDWSLNKIQIYDPWKDELVRIYDFTPWRIIGSTHSKNYTATYLMKSDYLGYRIVWFEKGRPENERSLLRDGIESIDCHRKIDTDVLEMLERGRKGWSLSIFDMESGDFKKVHDFEKIDVKESIWRQYRVVKNSNYWKFINGNKLYSLKIGSFEKQLLYTLPFDISAYDNYCNDYIEKLTAVRNDTLYFLRAKDDVEYDLSVFRLPSPMNINQWFKKIDVDDSGEWFSQSDSDSLRIFRLSGDTASTVFSTSSCLGGTFVISAGTFWKGDTLVHYGSRGLKIFKGADPIYSIDAEDIFVDYDHDLEKFVIYRAPGQYSVISINDLKTLWTKRYNVAYVSVGSGGISVFDNIMDKYLEINHIDGTSLLLIETGEEVLRVSDVATQAREVNQDTTRILLRGENFLGIYEISNRQKLMNDLIAVTASCKWALSDTTAALQNARNALRFGTSLSGDLAESLLDILNELNLQKESLRLIANMAIKTGDRKWREKLAEAGMELLIEPHLADYFAEFPVDDGIFAFPLIIYPHSVAKGEEKKCYWFPKPDYRAEERMSPIGGLSVAGDEVFLFEYKKDNRGEKLQWSPLHLTRSGELRNLGILLETSIEMDDPRRQFVLDYPENIIWGAQCRTYALTNMTINSAATGRMTYTIGIDMTGRGNNWIDSTTVDPVSVGGRFYAHEIYGGLVSTIAEGSQADSIGIKIGDIVISFGGYEIGITQQVGRIKTYYADRVPLELTVLRGGDTLSFTVLNGRIGYEYHYCYGLVEIDPETGEHLTEIELPPAYAYAAPNSSGEIVYAFRDTLLFVNPANSRERKVFVEGIEDFYRLHDIPGEDVLLMHRRTVGDVLALDISRDANDADRMLWSQYFGDIYRVANEPRYCITDDEGTFPIVLDNGTLLIIDAISGSVLSREILPFQSFGFLPMIFDGTFYGVIASWIFGWKVAYYHPPFPWRYMGYGASAIVPLLFMSLLVYRMRIVRLKRKQSVELKRAETEAEISAARRLQAGLIPTGSHKLGKFHLVGKFIPASEVGGDYFDFRLLDDGRLVVVMGDVSGHGLPAGILVSMAKASLMTVHRSNATDFKETLESLNEVIRNGSPGKEMFMTVCYLVLDPDKKKIACSANGHPFPLIAKKDGTILEVGSEGGYPLGVRDRQRFQVVEADFQLGDTLLVFTDGLPEQTNIFDEPWGYENLMRTFGEFSTRPEIESVVHGLLDRTLGYAGGAVQEDDMALVAIRYDLA